MKRKNIQNKNGISISDSIVMSVKKKHDNYRKPFSAAIALIGYISIIMAFLGMFKFNYDKDLLFFAVLGFGAIYLTMALISKKALWGYAASVVLLLLCAYKKSEKIADGFKFIYNIIYQDAYRSNIDYFKGLDSTHEVSSVNTLFFFYVWLLAIVIFFFTICRPNPVLPLMVTFPVLEIGMYNGIKVPVFWGVLCIAFWLALLAMSTIDVGEYSGGQSGFVRKNDLFFPKRHMKLKVTEKCGMLIIATVVGIAAVSTCFLKLTNYKRSEKLDEKRKDITDALNDFSFENFAESLANLTTAIGFDFEFENHKLGTNDHVRYKNVTDITVTLDKPVQGAIYLKDYAGSIYKKNEWFELPSSAYNSKVFDDFKEYEMYPQDFPATFSKMLGTNSTKTTIWIQPSSKKSKHIYAPYGTINVGYTNYNKDLTVSDKNAKKGECSYKFLNPDTDSLVEALLAVSQGTDGPNSRAVYSASDIKDSYYRDKILQYCTDNDLITYEDYFPVDYGIPASPDYMAYNGDALLSELLQNSYRDFVYQNYLDVPDTDAMAEVKSAYADILAYNDGTLEGELATLYSIRDRMSVECTYSLYPRKTPSNRDFVNYFLLENKKGYCTHYATSGVMLARMAGIPARYATGYVIVEKDQSNGQHRADGSIKIEVKDNRSHAWAEIYLDSIGWIPFEFTAGYSSQEINTQPSTSAEPTTTIVSDTTTTIAESTTTSGTRIQTATSSTVSSTASDATTVNKSGLGTGKGHSIHIPKFLKDFLITLFILALIICLILLRRYLIITTRNRKFTTGKPDKKVRSMYAYAEKLLKTLEMRSENGNFKEFAKAVEKSYGGVYFDEGGFEKLTDVALRASFSQEIPTAEEIEECKKIVESISQTIYDKSNFFDRLMFMYINVLR